MSTFKSLSNSNSRESKTVNEINATRRDYFNDGKVVLLGLTDRSWTDKNKVTQKRYQLCFAELTSDNKVARLVRMPFFTMMKSRLGIKDSETGKVFNNGGATIDFIESQYQQHADLKPDTLWYQHILPTLQNCVLDVERKVVRTTGSYGAYNAVLYNIAGAKATNGQSIKIDFNSIRAEVEALAKAGNIGILIDDDTVINSDALLKDEQKTDSAVDNSTNLPF